jgi:hypothetical protein
LRFIEVSIAERIRGRPTLVLGSAPGASAPDEYDPSTWSLICVNASGRIAKDLGLGTPDITVFAAGAITRNSASNIEMRAAISELETEVLVVRLLNREFLKQFTRRIAIRRRLRRFDYRYNQLVFVAPAEWEPVLASLVGPQQQTQTGNNHNVSTGIFCCALALLSEARRVVVAGIDPSSTGHAYSSSNQPRNHVSADQRAIAILRREKYVEFHATHGTNIE